MEIPTFVERRRRLESQIRRIDETSYPPHMQADKKMILEELRRRVAKLDLVKSRL